MIYEIFRKKKNNILIKFKIFKYWGFNIILLIYWVRLRWGDILLIYKWRFINLIFCKY